MPRVTNEPFLRATSESGDVMDDPSEDALFVMFQDIEAGRGSYLILDALADTTGQTYAQTSRNTDGSYLVEYRDGTADRHFGTTAEDMRAAHELLVGWAFKVPGWRDAATWTPVSG